jgi:hypothetical protein
MTVISARGLDYPPAIAGKAEYLSVSILRFTG